MAELDMAKLQSRTAKTVSSEEALKDVVPMEWPDEVLNGNQKVIITTAITETKK